jgi:hypothetical protein
VRELCEVMGFREDYVLPPARREAIHLLGNAVCPPVAADLRVGVLLVRRVAFSKFGH